MLFDGKHLTPATSENAGPDNYTWWKKGSQHAYPINAGFVFVSKAEIAEQIYADYAELPLPVITGTPAKQGKYCVIGGDGFGWYTHDGKPKRFPHVGGVRFGEGVEIGSCSTIDRGTLGDTVIGSFVKIDNGVHIGHNATIGDRSILTAHCVIGGSAMIGEDCWIGLGAQIKNQIIIGNNVTVGMGAIVVKDVPDNVTVIGNPARIM